MINQTDTVSPVDAKKCFSSTFFMIPNWLEKRSEKKLDKAIDKHRKIMLINPYFGGSAIHVML